MKPGHSLAISPIQRLARCFVFPYGGSVADPMNNTMCATGTAHDPRSTTVLARLDDMAGPLLGTGILLLPFISNTAMQSRALPVAAIVTVVLLLFAIVAISDAVVNRAVPTRPAALAGIVLAPVMTISFLLSPSGPGAILTAYAVIAAGVAVGVAALDRAALRRWVAGPLLVTSAVQSILVIAQTVSDRAIGLTLLQPDAQLHLIDGLLRPRGTMHHVYEPAALALLAAGIAAVTIPDRRSTRVLWIVGVALAGSTIGLTHSRSALLGLILMLSGFAVAALRRIPGAGRVGAALLLGFLIAAAMTASAWALRTEDSTSGNLDDASLGRLTLAKQAIEMVEDHPILGVGPGHYLETMRTEYRLDDRYPFVVHNVSLLVAAENGIAVAVIVSVLVGLAMIRAVRAGPLAAALALSLTGFLLFDALNYDRPVGLLMTSLWLGAIAVVSYQPGGRSRNSRSS